MIMAADYSKKKKKPVGKMLAFGIGSTILYALVLSYQGLITAYFTRGALYATLPIASAFAFSFVHGNFTSYFWTVLGIEANQKALKPRLEAERSKKRERPQPQPRLRA
jgi:amino acid permease